MPTEDPRNQNDQNDDGEGKVPRSHVRHLEEKAGKFDEVNEKYTALERENAFLKAGVDLDDPRAEYLVKGYDGELETDAIKSEAAKLGLIDAPGDEANEEDVDDVSDDERNFDDAASDAASGSPADETPDDHPSVTADKVAEQSIERGATREQALAASVSVLGEAGANGDDRVLWTPGQ